MPALPPLDGRSADKAAPALRFDSGTAELIVDGERFLIRGGEVHNSAVSTPEAARRALASTAAAGINTVLAPVTWEAFEPVEGEYETAVVDDLVDAARAVGLHVIVLWFGAFKNGASSYAPSWVKTDPERFPRCRDEAGTPMDTLSPFVAETRDADARAFARMAAHIELIDAADRTVLMIQVENEPGLLGCSRDHGPAPERLFAGPPAPEVLSAAGIPAPQASWRSAFGPGLVADERFMAWGFATYVEAVARAGRQRTRIPFFTNAWLDSEIDLPGLAVAGGQRPGVYPSGGPVPGVLPLWRRLAPTLDLIVPDVYFGDFSAICAAYRSASGGLFIPEMRRDLQGVGDAFVAVGEHRALGVSPFGIDSITEAESADLSDAYELLAAVQDELDATRARHGFHLPEGTELDGEVRLDFGDVELRATRLVPFGRSAATHGAYGLVVRLGPTRFLAVGRGFSITFHDPASGRRAGLLSVLEHAAVPPDKRGVRPVVRRLNGDETAGGTSWLHPVRDASAAEPAAIPMDPRHSGLSCCEVYWLA